MASQDPPTHVIQAPLQTPGVYDTAMECFRGVAGMLEKGSSPCVFTNDRDVILTPMPSGPGLRLVRISIENSLELLRMKLSQQSDWKKVRIMSEDKKEFFIILYRFDAFSSEQEAVNSALAKRLEMRQLEYIEVGGGESAI
jgi:hypothetical protein